MTEICFRSPAVDPERPTPDADRIGIVSAPPTAGSGQDDVAEVAYALFLARGGEHGHDVEDWLRAEQMVRERRSIACDLGLGDLDR